MSQQGPSDGPTEGFQMVTVRRAAQMLSVSETTVRKLIASGRLRASKFGRAVRVSVADLRELAEQSDWASV
ncbi:MAG: helix-turn-helix domain-containing protein [Actinomycetaceae bacterium]|nr:helix-turn-helix domain-containing protein [Actinomycetaceae bacterium]